jgi:hypothetical protein
VSKIRFPSPFQVRVVLSGKRKPETVDVEHWVTVDIPDLDETEAPIIAEFDKDFPSGVFEPAYTQQKTSVPFPRPKTEVRVYEGKFYYPLFSYDTKMDMLGGKLNALPELAPERLGIENFITGFYKSRKNVSAFATCHGLPSEFGFISHSFLEQVTKQLDGELPTLGSLDGRVEFTAQESVESRVREIEKHFVAINGNIWLLGGEPMLVASVDLNGDAKISLQRRTNKDARYLEDDHPFRLDRLDDCLAHVSENFGAAKVTVEFSDLTVFLPEVLRFEDELQPLHGAARKVVDRSKDRVEKMDKDQAMAWYDLRDAVESFRPSEDDDVPQPVLTEENAEEVAQTLDLFNQASRDCVDTKPYKFALAAVERWKMRPAMDRTSVVTPKRY